MANVIKFPELKADRTIDSIKDGQAFIYQHTSGSPKELWMRIEGEPSRSYNAIRVRDGKEGKFTSYNKGLIPVDLEIIVKEPS